MSKITDKDIIGYGQMPWVEIKCQGFTKRDVKCDWQDIYWKDGLNQANFKCPICGSTAYSLRTFEKIKPIKDIVNKYDKTTPQ